MWFLCKIRIYAAETIKDIGRIKKEKRRCFISMLLKLNLWFLFRIVHPALFLEDYICITPIVRGVFRNLSRGGVNFFLSRGDSAPVGAWKSPEINRFHCSRGGLAPIAPPWISLWFSWVHIISFDKMGLRLKVCCLSREIYLLCLCEVATFRNVCYIWSVKRCRYQWLI